jgi:type IV pilus assembly protein PilY1
MNRRTIAILASLVVAVTGTVLAPSYSVAQVNADYTAQPQFISNVVTPNILIVMDNSGSMSNRACESTSCGILSSGATSTVTTFVATTRYNGFADPLRCYTWDATDNRFENGAAKAALNTPCSSGTEYDGNFINWATFRRFDAVKKAMTGGNCWHPTASPVRNADGTCIPSGTPSLPTVKAQNLGTSQETTPGVPHAGGTGDTTYVGRIPTAVHPGNPANIFIQYEADGDMCIDDDVGTGCPDGGGMVETELNEIAFAQYSEPTGVIQQVGAKARFGLAVFNGSGALDGIQVLTPIASRQSINFSGTSVETFNTNTAAMIDSVDESSPATWTPLAESLYDAVRYVAQLNSNYYPTSYVYPIAFSGSGGVNFASNGIGSIGTAEITSLTGSETCPAGYISNACGRDPFFYGTNHTPAWVGTSQPVNCCKTFVLIFTDGEPTQDINIPAALQDYGHAHHGVHCTNSDAAAPPRPIDGTCNSNTLTPFNELLGEHKTDYASSGSGYLDSVAYWAHTTDLRPCTGTADGTIAVIGVTGHCLPGTQNVSVYTFFAFGNVNGRGILSQTAKLGAFEDANNDGIPQTGEWDKENNYTGVSTPDGIPDAYFESSNVDDLQDKMLATISSILRKSAAGSSVSVLATSTTGEGALYQSYFYPSTFETATMKDVFWTGYTQSLFIDTYGNLREDTPQSGVKDGKLIYTQDKILVTRYDPIANLVKVDYYDDANGDGLPDDKDSNGIINNLDCLPCDRLLNSISPVWEAGAQLALKDSSTRTILTWVDTDNDGVVDPSEQIPFTTANTASLSPYLRPGAAPFTASNIIEFIRGCEPSVCTTGGNQFDQLRERRLQVPFGSGTLKTWKLGDLIHSAPQVVASPSGRYDSRFGDRSYQAFLATYYNRRQVIYAGANDGMLHAFNGGYYHPGDDPATGTSASPIVEHGWFTRTPTDNSSGPQLGDELWGFIPQQLLPHLQWLARTDYQHVYYVDLQPTIADVRIFTPDADHPNGWGTILIGGMRLGGSCRGAVSPAAATCVGGTGAPPMSVTADFGSGVVTRKFYSAYFVLDITNPEVAPKLLMSFTDEGMGLTTSLPKVVRVNPSTDNEVLNTNAKWYMVVGSGPTGYAGGTTQSATVYAVNLATGPGASNSLVQRFSVGSWNSFIGDMASFDRNLDYRTDSVYFGRVIHDGSLPWRGKLYRLTLGETIAGSDPPVFGTQAASAWGISSGANRIPTEILDTFTGTCAPTPCSAPTIEMGPVATAPGIAIDDAAKVWVFAGSGRYYGASDKTDTTPQYFVGMKDSVINLTCTQSSSTNCQDNDLLNVTSATVCIVGQGDCGQVAGTNQVTGVTGATSFTSLIALIQSKEGWYTTLPQSGAANGERVLAAPVVFAGIVYFPTFTPTNDICASSGTSYLYALYYKTGSAYTESIIGTTPGVSGNVNVSGKMSLGEGLAFGGVTHIGSGSDGGAPVKICNNTSTGALLCNDSDTAGGGDNNMRRGRGGRGGPNSPFSHFISWINQ